MFSKSQKHQTAAGYTLPRDHFDGNRIYAYRFQTLPNCCHCIFTAECNYVELVIDSFFVLRIPINIKILEIQK